MTITGTVVGPGPATDPVLSCAAVVAGFEITMLVRCARTGSGRYGRGAPGGPGTAVELGRTDAADRLVELLETLDVPVRRDQFAAGGRHRYTVHRVICPDLDQALLDRAWCAGYRRLCATPGYRSARQRRHHTDLAAAAWRAAVLTGSRRSRSRPLAVRVTEAELALVLVRAARVLGAPVSLRTTGTRHLVETTGGAAEVTLRELIESGITT